MAVATSLSPPAMDFVKNHHNQQEQQEGNKDMQEMRAEIARSQEYTCPICKHKSSDKHCFHYGGISCYSCRAFFRRAHQVSVGKRQQYRFLLNPLSLSLSFRIPTYVCMCIFSLFSYFSPSSPPISLSLFLLMRACVCVSVLYYVRFVRLGTITGHE